MRSIFVAAAAALKRSGPDRVQNVASDFQGSTGATAGDPLANDPATQAQYLNRRPLRFPLTLPVQNLRNGFVIPQAGAGRATIPANLGIAPIQSVSRGIADGRIIARPMPRSGTDSGQVIR